MKPIIISGKIGSGKSTVCKLFERKKYFVINADLIAKDLIQNNKKVQQKLIEVFGENIIVNKSISFDKLREILCSSKKNKDAIDKVVHPIFYDEVHKIISDCQNKNIIIEIPLIETCNNLNIDHILVFIKTNKATRKSRYLENKNFDDNTFEKLNEFQTNTDLSINISDYVISNDGNMDELITNFSELYRKINNE